MNRKGYQILILVFISVGALALSTPLETVDRPRPYVLGYPSYFGNHYTIPADNPMTVAGVALGRMLFYETALSAGNKISCGTCHQQAHAFTDGKDFSQGADGIRQPRNTMALVNVLWERNLFWDGRTQGLENQVDSPLTKVHEEGQSFPESIQKLERKGIYASQFRAAFGDPAITKERIEKALAQFERTLVSARSKYDLYLQGKYEPTRDEMNGIALFYGGPNPEKQIRGASCSHCHGGPKTYDDLFMNNGLDSVYKDPGRAAFTGQDYDLGRFRVVTLRNIALTAPYMHDARFKSLKEVVDHYSDHIQRSRQLSPFLQNNSNTLNGEQLDLTAVEKRDLVSFLNMLTDSTFIVDKRFSDPFASN